MIISDLNYLETVAEASHVEGAGTGAEAGSSAAGVGVFTASTTNAKTVSLSTFFFKVSAAKTEGKAFAVLGGATSTSYAASYAG